MITIHHLKMVKTLLRYLKGTAHYAVRYPAAKRDSKVSLIAYSDSDWAGSIEDRRSTTGTLLQLQYNDLHGHPVHVPILWRSKKQPLVATSTAEAEYIAACETALDVVWIRGLLKDLGCEQANASALRVDNQSCIAIATNSTSSTSHSPRTSSLHLFPALAFQLRVTNHVWFEGEYQSQLPLTIGKPSLSAIQQALPQHSYSTTETTTSTASLPYFRSDPTPQIVPYRYERFCCAPLRSFVFVTLLYLFYYLIHTVYSNLVSPPSQY